MAIIGLLNFNVVCALNICQQDSFKVYWYESKHLKGQLWPRVCHVFVYSCPAPPPLVSCDPACVTFCLFLPCTPSPGQLWPRVCHVFVYSCPAPPPLVSCDPACVTFLFFPALHPLPWSVVTLRVSRFCLFLPCTPSPGQLWLRVCHVFVYSCPAPQTVSWRSVGSPCEHFLICTKGSRLGPRVRHVTFFESKKCCWASV